MKEHSGGVTEVYRRFLSGALRLDEAAELLRQEASSGFVPTDTLDLDKLPQGEREKAAELLNEAIQPVCRAFMSGQVTTQVAAQQLAPLVLPVGVFALNFNMPHGPHSAEAIARFGELCARLAEVIDVPRDEG